MLTKQPRRYDDRVEAQRRRQQQIDNEINALLGSARPLPTTPTIFKQAEPLTNQMKHLDLSSYDWPTRSLPDLQLNKEKMDKNSQEQLNHFDEILERKWAGEVEDPKPIRQRSASHSHYHPYQHMQKRHSGRSFTQLPSPVNHNFNQPTLGQQIAHHQLFHASSSNTVNLPVMQQPRQRLSDPDANRPKIGSNNENLLNENRMTRSSTSSATNLSYYNHQSPPQWHSNYVNSQTSTLNNNSHVHNLQWEQQIPNIVLTESAYNPSDWYREL